MVSDTYFTHISSVVTFPLAPMSRSYVKVKYLSNNLKKKFITEVLVVHKQFISMIFMWESSQSFRKKIAPGKRNFVKAWTNTLATVIKQI